MPVVEIDAGLVVAGPAALEAALADHAGTPTAVVVHGAGAVDLEQGRALRALPFLVAAAGPGALASAGAVDVVLDSEFGVDALRAGFERAPIAATAAALLLRDDGGGWWNGLVRESTTYSMLQAGPEFRAWRAAHDPRPVTADDQPRVRVVHHEHVTEIALARGARHNALDRRTRDVLDGALVTATIGPGPIVLLGDGPSFSSGGDLDEFGTFSDPAAAHLVRLGRSLAARLAQAGERIVVGVHGATLGSGIELAAFARHVVAAADAQLGLPELTLGLVPGAGGTVSLPRRVGRHRTLRLLLLGGTIPAPTARSWGLVDEVVDEPRLRRRCLEVAESLL